ncbi:MAG: hypothetical protein MJ091_02345 [Clostridia bacterium]|nr:hypothetical protein [Clostridia bacterium]
MKRKATLFIFALIFMLLIPFTVSAKEKEYEISFPAGFTVAYSPDGMKDAAKILGIDYKDAKDFFEKENLMFFALDKSGVQARLCSYESEFSKTAVDISSLKDTQILSIADKLTDAKNCETVKKNGVKYIVITETLKDSGGNYVSTQYITVKNSKIYQLSFYSQGESKSLLAEDIFDTFVILSTERKNSNFIFIGIAALMAVFAAIIVIMVFKIIRSIKIKEK